MTTPVGNSTMGLRLAQAYGAAAPGAARPAAKVQPSQTAASVQALRAADRVDVAARLGPADAPKKTEQLVAAVVPGRVDFTVGDGRGPAATQPAPQPLTNTIARRADAASLGSGPLPFYRAPSDRNAAATAIMLGRTVDVAG